MHTIVAQTVVLRVPVQDLLHDGHPDKGKQQIYGWVYVVGSVTVVAVAQTALVTVRTVKVSVKGVKTLSEHTVCDRLPIIVRLWQPAEK